jgi:hypothetical protein
VTESTGGYSGDKMISVQVISAGDNYLYLCSLGSGEVFLIDPSESRKTLSALEQHQLKLTHRKSELL